MIRYLVPAALAAVALAAPAQARDGIRISGAALVGYDEVELDADLDPELGFDEGDVDIGSEGDVLYGVSVGVETKLGSGVFGVEAEYADSQVSRSAGDLLVDGDSARLSAGRDLYLGLRGGYWLSPRVLFYAKGGYTNARFTARYDDGDGSVTRDHTNRDGFRLGAGVEYALTRNLGLRGEYRHSEYESLDTGLGVAIDANRDQFVAGLVAGF